MSWNKLEHKFGTVNKGKPVDCSFKWSGDSKITSAHGSCGCQVTKHTDKEVFCTFTPKKSTLKAVKRITVKTDDDKTHSLKITAVVR